VLADESAALLKAFFGQRREEKRAQAQLRIGNATQAES
jgi:hypothetical protein